jgi:hypothetical protein
MGDLPGDLRDVPLENGIPAILFSDSQLNPLQPFGSLISNSGIGRIDTERRSQSDQPNSLPTLISTLDPMTAITAVCRP